MLPAEQQASLRAYWMLQHSQHPERMLLSAAVTGFERSHQVSDWGRPNLEVLHEIATVLKVGLRVERKGGPAKSGGISDAVLQRAARAGDVPLGDLRKTFGGGE